MNEINFDLLLRKVSSYTKKNLDMITKAYNRAYELHKMQTRESGEAYINHPLNVAYILSGMHADVDTICAALLHDAVEDTEITLNDIEKEFNETVRNLVDGVTKMNQLSFNDHDEFAATNIRKIIVSIKNDARIIIIKLVDRLHNMRTLEYKKSDRQQAISLETLEIYVPMAYYIGAYKIKDELENLSFKYLKPDVYSDLLKKLNIIHQENQKMLDKMVSVIKKKLKEQNIKCHVEVRYKDAYSVYKKLITRSTIENIHDLLGIKIIVNDIKDCYLALMIIHENFPPLSFKFKDYIMKPKTNMYQALHTTVFGNHEHLVQFQIRTKEMERNANYGLTSYWFKNNHFAISNMQKDLEDKFQFFKSINELDSSIIDNQEFVKLAKTEIFSSNVYVRTMSGEVIELPLGSTPIDFAYKIHTEIGNTMIAAIVNEEVVPFNYVLKNTDRIRIVTDNNAIVNRNEWLNIAITTHAKRAIMDYLRKNEK